MNIFPRQKTQNRRKIVNWLIKPSIQLRFGLYSNLLTLLLSGACAYFLFVSIEDLSQMLSVYIEKEKNFRGLVNNYLKQTQMTFSISVLCFLILNLILSVVLSHRVVGPIFAIHKQIKTLLKGDFSQRVRLRKDDAFKPLAKDLNQLTELLEKKYIKKESHPEEQKKLS